MQIAELKAGPPSVMIIHPGLFALVTKVQPRKTGTSNYGDWSMQGITLKDNSGEIHATVWGKPDLSVLLNTEIQLSAVNTEGKGWQGCQIEDRQWNDKASGTLKTARQIKASGTFLLEKVNRASQSAQNDAMPPANPSEMAPAQPQPAYTLSKPPDWNVYTAVVRSAHSLAQQLEPDMQRGLGGESMDRARARSAIMNTILIAWGKHDFEFTGDNSDDDIPF